MSLNLLNSNRNRILPLKDDVVYGPVNSRRLGKSLGINLLTASTKVCTLNCLYCQYGYTAIKPDMLTQPANFFPAGMIRDGLEEILKNGSCRPDYLTFSGNGEATLHPDFPDLVKAVKSLRDGYCPDARTAILSNGTQIGQPQIQAAFTELVNIIIKLDCAETVLYRHYNRPVIPVNLKRMISILAGLPNITIQALFTAGKGGNFSGAHLKTWIRTIQVIRPVMVQLYSLDRGYSSKHITKLSADDLQPLADELLRSGIPARRY